MVTYPYAFASTLYTWGAWCSVRASLAAVRAAAAQQSRVAAAEDPMAAGKKLPGAAQVTVLLRQPGWRRQLTPGMAWALLDLAGWVPSPPKPPFSSAGLHAELAMHPAQPGHVRHSQSSYASFKLWQSDTCDTGAAAAMVGIWVGTLLYNSSCITPAVLCTFPVPPKQAAWASHWLITVAANIAGCLFVSGSFACWASAERTLSLLRLIRLPRDPAYWSSLAYLLVRPSCMYLHAPFDSP